LWATPLTQLFPRTPIGEIVRHDAPAEILGVIPALADADLVTLGQIARRAATSGSAVTAQQMSHFDIGRIKVASADLRLLTPALVVPHDSYFVRLLFAQSVPSSEFRTTANGKAVPEGGPAGAAGHD